MIDLIVGGTPTTASQLLNWLYANTVVERNGVRNVFHIYSDGYMKQSRSVPALIGNNLTLKLIYKGELYFDYRIQTSSEIFKGSISCPNSTQYSTLNIALTPDLEAEESLFNINIKTHSHGYLAYIAILGDTSSADINTDDFVSALDYKTFIENAILYGPDAEKPMLR